MPFKLQPPVEETFFLDKTDEAYPLEVTNEGEPQRTTVLIRQATQAQHERRSDLFSKLTSRVGNDPDVVEIVTRFSFPELQRIECFLAVKDCNIEDEDGKPLFKFKNGVISEADFNRGWGKLPPLVCDEIHQKVLELNPTWGKMGEGQ
jgi:hypothetical protein